jgi:hypothetical protein
MSFCPNCGAALKAEKPVVEAAPPAPPAPYRGEKGEKGEKREKGEKGEKAERPEKREKTEKGERREYGFVGPLIGGLVLIFVGAMLWLAITTPIGWGVAVALLVVIIGIIIIVGALYAAMMATRRHPAT